MAGHSKWKNIKHKKAASDAFKGKVFSKIAKEIVVAARHGGGDPGQNITLRAVIQKARAANMPADNIERAIKRGTGEAAGAALEEIVYEGFAPGGVSIVAVCLTDNKNRTASEVRFAFTKHGGNLAQQGSVMRNYKRKGFLLVAAAGVDEDKLIEVALEAGAEDVNREGDFFEVTSDPAHYPALAEALGKAGIKAAESEIGLIPDLEVPVTDKEKGANIIKFIEALEELDDVQNVYTNANIDDAVMEAAG
ncbi:MAG TPA: YebC/PmpR family DNA-binding transcriptional regulator [Kiritimatiellia bacterium]|jgi:YebC/PmpR family DNA-binding regulatory protein